MTPVERFTRKVRRILEAHKHSDLYGALAALLPDHIRPGDVPVLDMADLAAPLPSVFVVQFSCTQALVEAGTELTPHGFALHGVFSVKHDANGALISAAAVFLNIPMI